MIAKPLNDHYTISKETAKIIAALNKDMHITPGKLNDGDDLYYIYIITCALKGLLGKNNETVLDLERLGAFVSRHEGVTLE
jgi:hypothetical protein